jgi:hypothetical protein
MQRYGGHMSDVDTKQKASSDKSKYVKTFRHGAVAANVFRRTAPGGFEYMDFSVSRAWKAKGGKEGFSQNFFPQNRVAIKAAVDEACDYIEQSPKESANTPHVSK